MAELEEIYNEEGEEQENNALLWSALGLSFGIDVFVSRIDREIELLGGAGMSDLAIIGALAGVYKRQELCKALGSDKITFMGIT